METMEAFLDGPLVQWLRTFPEAPGRITFEDLTAGPFLHNIMQTLDSDVPGNEAIGKNGDFRDKVKNMEALIKNIKYFYEDVLSQCVVIALPDSLLLSRDPPTQESMVEMDKLLLLILGAAVQCSQKEQIIDIIKRLPVETQHAIVIKIKEVTENPEQIWPSELSDPRHLNQTQKDQMYSLLVRHVRTLVRQRDEFAQRVVDISIASPPEVSASAEDITPEKNHLMLELAEYKHKLRKLQQELVEKTESLSECKEEIEKKETDQLKLKQEMVELTQEARAAKAYRDELDSLREKADKVNRLEDEIQRYKDIINDIQFYKARCEELKEDNKLLGDEKDMIEKQLEGQRRKCEQIPHLEYENLKLKSAVGNLEMEREDDKRRIEELMDENVRLQLNSKNSLSESLSLQAEMAAMKGPRGNDTNILSEQIGQDTTHLHRLQLENRKLMSELEDLKSKGFHETKEKILQLEKEKKKLSLSVKKMEEVHNKDSDQNVQLEKHTAQVEAKNQELTQVVSTLKESEQQLRIEKDTEIENLNKQVESLRKRQQQSQNEQVILLEEENKRMTRERTQLQTKVTSLEHERKQLSTKLKEYKENLEVLEYVRTEKQKLELRIDDVMKENENLRNTQDSHNSLTESYEELEEKLKKLTNAHQRIKEDYEKVTAENLKLTLEVKRLSAKIEAFKSEKTANGALEQENDNLKETINQMRNTIETSRKTLDEQEQKLANANAESHRVQRQISTMQRRLDEIENENKELESENKKLNKTIETLKMTARRVEQLEKENVDLEGVHHKVERESKSLRKETERLKVTLDVKDLTIEELTSKMSTLEREKNKLSKELEHWNGENSKLQELEAENRQLTQGSAVDKRTLMELREELVHEKIKSDEISNELENLNKQLRKIGVDKNTLSGELEQHLSNERVKNLEGSLNTLLGSRDRKISALETQLNEAIEEKSVLLSELEFLKMKVKTGDNKAAVERQMAKVMRERDELQMEIASLKVNVSAAEEKAHQFEDRMKSLQDRNAVLTREQVSIGVENSTLQSQSASLLAQINVLQTAQVKAEEMKGKMEESEKLWKTERNQLLQDQDRLQKLHNNLQSDYEKLLKEKEEQKAVEKTLRGDLRKLQAMSLSLSEGQDDLLRAREAIEFEKENLRTDARTLSNLRSEHARLKDDFRSLFTSNERVKQEYCNLQTDYKSLKTAHNTLKLQQTDLKGQLTEAKDQLTMLDVEHTKALNRCEVLHQLNLSLEDDRKSLMSQVSMLLSQYHDLLTQTLDDKEHFHEEERIYTDRMHHLARQKEKLEEKIMEQYKRMESQTPKKLSFGGQLVRKMRKASSNLINPRPRSISRGRGLPSSSSSVVGGAGGRDDGHDTSSVGSSANDSLDSGQHSPTSATNENGLIRSESAIEIGSRKQSATAHALQNASFRKSLPSHMEDSDGNIGDDDSVNSLVSGNGHYLGRESERYYPEHDDIPTRDVGPEKLSSQGFSSHSEIGLPILPPDDNRSRSISRLYVNGGGGDLVSDDHRSTTPRLMAWKSNNSSPSPSNGSQEEGGVPPVVPARKPSKARAPDAPPQRPPKPGIRRITEDSRKMKEDLMDEDEKKAENTEWYEYGCV